MHSTLSLGNKKIQKKSVPKDPKVIPIHKALVLPHASACTHLYSFTPSYTLT